MAAFASLTGCISVFAFVRRFKRRMKGCAAMGTVVSNQERRSSDSTTYSPEVEFQTPDGKRITFVAPFGSSRRSTLGRRVNVVYYPNDPEDAAVLSFGDLWVIPFLLMLFAAGCLAMSVMFYAGILENQQ
jgi:hypothetical protein